MAVRITDLGHWVTEVELEIPRRAAGEILLFGGALRGGGAGGGGGLRDGGAGGGGA